MKFNISNLIASLLVSSAMLYPCISNAATGAVEILNIQDDKSCSHTSRVQNMACNQAIKEGMKMVALQTLRTLILLFDECFNNAKGIGIHLHK